MVKPVDDLGGGNEWDGAINMVRTSMQKNYDDLHEEFTTSFEFLKDLVTESRQRQTAQDRETKKQIAELMKQIQKSTTL